LSDVLQPIYPKNKHRRGHGGAGARPGPLNLERDEKSHYSFPARASETSEGEGKSQAEGKKVRSRGYGGEEVLSLCQSWRLLDACTTFLLVLVSPCAHGCRRRCPASPSTGGGAAHLDKSLERRGYQQVELQHTCMQLDWSYLHAFWVRFFLGDQHHFVQLRHLQLLHLCLHMPYLHLAVP